MQDYKNITDALRSLDRDSLLRVSGFIDALVSSSGIVSIQPESPAHNTLVAYASQTGNAELVADQIKSALEQEGQVVKQMDVAELSLKKLNSYSHLLLVASTHGEGEPPDTAIEFAQQFESSKLPKLVDLSYSVIALGDKSYDQFCEFGLALDKKLEGLGANRIKACLQCDVDYQDEVETWLKDILVEFKRPSSVAEQSSPQVIAKAKSTYTIKNPLPVEVLANVNLCTEKSHKEVHHLELEVPADQISYSPGDSIGIHVKNPQAMVAEIAELTELNLEEEVLFKDEQVKLEDCLVEESELFRLTIKQLESFIKAYPNNALTKALNDKNSVAEFIRNHDWLSILKYYTQPESKRKNNKKSLENAGKAKLFTAAQDFVNFLNPKSQRLYSVSSSPLAHEDEVHLTIRLREFSEEKRLGLVSGNIAALKSGDQIAVYPKVNKNFHLPEDADAPIIMIGAGTGVAPFRSFLYERLEQGVNSPSWLFFGEQYFRESFLYQTDWLKFLQKGTLNEFTVAFSRDGSTKEYVQDKLREHAKQLFQWIEEGAYLYVCGSADGMGKEVHQALLDIISEQAGLDKEASKQKLQKLMIDGYYKRDVY